MNEVFTAVMTGATKTRSYDGDYMKAGKAAESIVMEFLRCNPEVVGVEDIRELRPMQAADADCIIYNADGTVVLAEIKSDSYLGKSGNVIFEALRINHTAPPDKAATLGWTARSPATYFLFYAPSVDCIYQCRANDLRAAFQKYTSEAREHARYMLVPTDNVKSTVTYLIPWKYCQDIFTIHELIPF
jgi:hypothetical protein